MRLIRVSSARFPENTHNPDMRQVMVAVACSQVAANWSRNRMHPGVWRYLCFNISTYDADSLFYYVDEMVTTYSLTDMCTNEKAVSGCSSNNGAPRSKMYRGTGSSTV